MLKLYFFKYLILYFVFIIPSCLFCNKIDLNAMYIIRLLVFAFIKNSKPTNVSGLSLLVPSYQGVNGGETKERVYIIIFVPHIVLGAHKSDVVSSTKWNVHSCSTFTTLCLNKTLGISISIIIWVPQLNVNNVILYINDSTICWDQGSSKSSYISHFNKRSAVRIVIAKTN